MLIEIDAESIRDHELAARATEQLERAKAALAKARTVEDTAKREVAVAWDAAAATAAASGGDTLVGAERHAAAVARASFASRIVEERTKELTAAQERYNSHMALSYLPVLRKGKELRAQAAAAADRARAVLAEAEALNMQGTNLIMLTRRHGLAQSVDIHQLHSGVKTAAAEAAFWGDAK